MVNSRQRRRNELMKKTQAHEAGADVPDSAWRFISCSSSTRSSEFLSRRRDRPQLIRQSCARSVVGAETHKILKTVEIPQAEFMPPCHTEVLEIRSSRRPWSSHRSSTLRVSSTEWLICPLLHEIMSPWSRQRRTPLRSNRPVTLTGSKVSVLMRRQVQTTQTVQKQQQMSMISKVLRTTEVPQVQYGAGCPGYPVPQIEEEQTATVVKVIPQERISERTVEQIADVPAIAKELTRARRDSAGAGSAAHRGASTPVTAHSSIHPEGFRVRDL